MLCGTEDDEISSGAEDGATVEVASATVDEAGTDSTFVEVVSLLELGLSDDVFGGTLIDWTVEPLSILAWKLSASTGSIG